MDAFDAGRVIDWQPPQTAAEVREARRMADAREEEECYPDFLMWLVLEAKRNRDRPGSAHFDVEDGAAFLRRMARYRKEQDAEWEHLTRGN